MFSHLCSIMSCISIISHQPLLQKPPVLLLYVQEVMPSGKRQLRQQRRRGKAWPDPRTELERTQTQRCSRCMSTGAHPTAPSPLCRRAKASPSPRAGGCRTRRYPVPFSGSSSGALRPDRGRNKHGGVFAGVRQSNPVACSAIPSVLLFKADYKIFILASNKCQSAAAAAEQELL